MTRMVLAVHDAAPPHWVGDGFPARSVFSYDNLGRETLSPFLWSTRSSTPGASPARAVRRG